MFLRNYKLENGRYTSASAEDLISGIYNDDTGRYSIDPQPVESVNAAVLAQHKVECRAVINAARTDKINEGVALDGVEYDSDANAKANVSGAVTMFLAASAAGSGESFEQPWIAKDDSVNVLNGAKIVELGMLIGVKISEEMTTANAAKVALSAAESIEAADEIVADYKTA